MRVICDAFLSPRVVLLSSCSHATYLSREIHLPMTGRKNRALQVPYVVPYKT